jgi:hypothetical protein
MLNKSIDAIKTLEDGISVVHRIIDAKKIRDAPSFKTHATEIIILLMTV